MCSTFEEVRLNCPQSCGLCCDNDPQFILTTTNGKSITCENIADSTTYKEKFCDRYYNQTMVRNVCPAACDFCQTPVGDPSPNSTNDIGVNNNETLEPDDDTLEPEESEDNETVKDKEKEDGEQKEEDNEDGSQGFDTTALGISLGASVAILGVYFAFKKTRRWKEQVASSTSSDMKDDTQSYSQQLQNMKKSLRLQEKSLGKSHVENAKAHYDIGTLKFNNNDKADSFQDFQRALNILDIETTEYNPNVATLHYMMGQTYKSQGKYAQATAAFKKALKIHEKIEKRSSNISKLYLEIGEMKRRRGDIEEALKFTRAALYTEEAITGCKDIKTALLHERIATLLLENKDPTHAYKSYRWALEVLTENLLHEYGQKRHVE